jgi:predicted phosphodiesterase
MRRQLIAATAARPWETYMRIAIPSDIHGNVIALDEVLADIQSQGKPDLHWVLGDFAALGSDPAGVIERVRALPNARFVHGNTDRNTVTGDLLHARLDEATLDTAFVRELIEAARGLAWTLGAVCATGHLGWLASLPLEQRLTLPDGTRVLGVHASPGRDDGLGIHPKLTDDELADMLAGCGADLVFVGHTHLPLDWSVSGVRVVNLGNVSNPVTADLRASYVLLDVTESGYHVERRRVEYDRAAAIAALEASSNPSTAFIAEFLRGERRSPWARDEEASIAPEIQQ